MNDAASETANIPWGAFEAEEEKEEGESPKMIALYFFFAFSSGSSAYVLQVHTVVSK